MSGSEFGGAFPCTIKLVHVSAPSYVASLIAFLQLHHWSKQDTTRCRRLPHRFSFSHGTFIGPSAGILARRLYFPTCDLESGCSAGLRHRRDESFAVHPVASHPSIPPTSRSRSKRPWAVSHQSHRTFVIVESWHSVCTALAQLPPGSCVLCPFFGASRKPSHRSSKAATRTNNDRNGLSRRQQDLWKATSPLEEHVRALAQGCPPSCLICTSIGLRAWRTEARGSLSNIWRKMPHCGLAISNPRNPPQTASRHLTTLGLHTRSRTRSR